MNKIIDALQKLGSASVIVRRDNKIIAVEVYCSPIKMGDQVDRYKQMFRGYRVPGNTNRQMITIEPDIDLAESFKKLVDKNLAYKVDY